MFFEEAVERRPVAEQRRSDEALYDRQIAYVWERSPFYRQKLEAAGFKDLKAVGGLGNIANLPFTVKDEIRKTQSEHPPLGAHLACDPKTIRRIFSTSGTTGVPCFIALTPRDTDVWALNTARSYFAAGFRPGQRLIVAFNAGPFVAGAAYYGFDRLGATVIPVGTGNTERFVKAIQLLGEGNAGISCTPSYVVYLLDWCLERGIDTRKLGIRNVATAGEPGGGDPALRERAQRELGAMLREAMGIGDISTSIWGECEHEGGMHFSARDNTYAELIDADSGKVIPWEDGAQGELVYTSLVREAMPMLRLRSRDHVTVNMQPCKCGRVTPRIRCIGRTDDMLIVRGVNLFPTAVRSVLAEFRPTVGESFRIRPLRKGVAQDPPLPVQVELAEGIAEAPADLGERIRSELRSRLLVATEISFVSWGTIPREEYKAKLVDWSGAGA